MWRNGMWYDEERSGSDYYLRLAGAILAVLLVIGLIIWTLFQGMNRATKRINRMYGDGTQANAPYSPLSPQSTVYYPSAPLNAGSPYTATASPPLPAPLPAAVALPAMSNAPRFKSAKEQDEVKTAVGNLRGLVKTMRQYDSAFLRDDFRELDARSAAPLTAIDEAGEERAVNPLSDDSERERQREIASRIYGETESLATELTLCTHPDLFPEKARSAVGEASRELRSYLMTVRLAIADSDGRSSLLTKASTHLQRGEAAVREVEQASGATEHVIQEESVRASSLIRDIPDFPIPGILFKDITPVLADAKALQEVLEAMVHAVGPLRPDLIAGIESRGFLFGVPVAQQLGVGFAPIRKPGKLPYHTIRQEYSLEYGTGAVEIHRDAVQPGQRVVIVDDLLATGGTAAAAAALVQQLEGTVAGFCFLIELTFLNGRERLQGHDVSALIAY